MTAFDPDHIAVRSEHYIDGRYTSGRGDTLPVKRPSDGRVHALVARADAAIVDEAVESAWKAFRSSDWARRPPRERARILRRWADLIEADVATLAPMEAVGSTRPLRDVASGDIAFTAEGFRFFAEYADKLGGEVAATRDDHLGMTIAEPYGVVAAIAPWNFPLVMVSWKAGPALAAGNAVVLKPSELTPFTAVRLAELAVAAGMPAGIFNVVQGDGATTGDALCRHPRVAKVTFTGSTRTGGEVMTACAQSGVKPVTLELGGKSPQLVFDDAADLDRLAQTLTRAITSNAGQVCIAGSRLVVQRRIAEPLIDRIVKLFRDLQPGPTWETMASLSPIVSAAQAARIDEIVKRSMGIGAEAITGGACADVPYGGAYYQPTLLAGVTSETPAVREEVFGPVLTVQLFDDEDEGIDLADHPTYGLAAGVHTSDIGRALRAVRRLEAGTVWVNRFGRTSDFVLPTGGYKGSGIGKDLGRQAYEANLRFKSVLVDFARPAAQASRDASAASDSSQRGAA